MNCKTTGCNKEAAPAPRYPRNAQADGYCYACQQDCYNAAHPVHYNTCADCSAEIRSNEHIEKGDHLCLDCWNARVAKMSPKDQALIAEHSKQIDYSEPDLTESIARQKARIAHMEMLSERD